MMWRILDARLRATGLLGAFQKKFFLAEKWCNLNCALGIVAEIRPLYTGARLNLGDRVLGEVEINSFIALPGKAGPQWANAFKTVCPTLEGVVRRLIVPKEQGMISWWTFFWLVGGAVIGSQYHQPSGSNRFGVYLLVGSMQLTSSTCWGFQYLQNSSKDMAQNIIYSPWRRTKCPWLCLMAKVLLFCFAWLFSFLSAFSHFSD